MRYIKILFLIVFFFVAMLFFFQNTQPLNTTISLELNLFFAHLKSVPIPMYFLVLASFALGGIVVLFYFLAEKIRLGSELKQCKRRMASLQQEVNSLRTLPVDEDSSYGSGDDDEASRSED